MRPVEPVLTVVSAARVVPPACGLADWRREALACWDDPAPQAYRDLCRIAFDGTGLDPRGLCAQAPADGADSPRAADSSQLELARSAVQTLQPPWSAGTQTRLLLYATSGVDEDIFHSTASCLAAELGASAVPHPGLGQLQGASLDLAAALLDQALPAPGAAGLFVAVERWPLPYPRLWGGSVLADGAAALGFVRGHAVGLQYLGGVQHGHDPFVVVDCARQAGIRRDALEQAAGQAIVALQRAHPDVAVDGWLGCALDVALDDRLRGRHAPAARHVLAAPPDAGQLGTITAAGALAELHARCAAGLVPHGCVLLAWNASLGGTVCASLWRVNRIGEDA